MLKKMISFAAAAVLASGCLTAAAADLKGGDVNNDGKIDVIDVAKIAAHVKGAKSLDGSSLAKADVNGDGEVNVKDVARISAHVKGVSNRPVKPAEPTAEQYAEEMAKLVNKERAARGLTYLRYSPELCKAANIRAKEIASDFSHERAGGLRFSSVLDEVGISYTAVKENIAGGQTTPKEAMSDFMESSIHAKNILSKEVRYMGIGVYKKGSTYYWVQLFADGNGMTGVYFF